MWSNSTHIKFHIDRTENRNRHFMRCTLSEYILFPLDRTYSSLKKIWFSSPFSFSRHVHQILNWSQHDNGSFHQVAYGTSQPLYKFWTKSKLTRMFHLDNLECLYWLGWIPGSASGRYILSQGGILSDIHFDWCTAALTTPWEVSYNKEVVEVTVYKLSVLVAHWNFFFNNKAANWMIVCTQVESQFSTVLYSYR